MKRLLLITVCLFCLLPVLQAQSETGARLWLDSPRKLKEPFILGFIMGGLVMEDKMVARLSAIGGSVRKKLNKTAATINAGRPGRPAQKEPWQRSIPELITAMDGYYRLPEHKDVILSDALYAVIFGPETADKDTGNDKK